MTLTRKKVVDLAKKALAPHQPADYQMDVPTDGAEKIDGIWHVAVIPSREDIRGYDFNARLAEAAMDLVRQKNVYIQFYHGPEPVHAE